MQARQMVQEIWFTHFLHRRFNFAVGRWNKQKKKRKKILRAKSFWGLLHGLVEFYSIIQLINHLHMENCLTFVQFESAVSKLMVYFGWHLGNR